jgi:pimeloyl-ACP methyl ester carboxylesterase
MRRRAFLEMLWPPDALSTADKGELAARVGALVGRDLADRPAVLMKQVRAMARHDSSGQLGTLGGIPTLVVSADNDPIALPRYGRMIESAIPGARYHEIKAASHGVTIQKAEQINDLLKEFVEATDASRLYS